MIQTSMPPTNQIKKRTSISTLESVRNVLSHRRDGFVLVITKEKIKEAENTGAPLIGFDVKNYSHNLPKELLLKLLEGTVIAIKNNVPEQSDDIGKPHA